MSVSDDHPYTIDGLRNMLQAVGEFSRDVRAGQVSEPMTEAEQRDWTKRYLLSAHREMSDLLNAMPGWKEHRHTLMDGSVDLDTMVEEACDVINYLLATLDLWGVDATELSEVWSQKLNVLRQRRYQEAHYPVLAGERVVMVDLDGCVADFRRGLLEWIRTYHIDHGGPVLLQHYVDPATDLRIDVDLGIEPSVYRELKHQFEREGGYGILPAFHGAAEFLDTIRNGGVRIVFLTSRPTVPTRVYRDTLKWLNGIGMRQEEFILELTRHKAEWLRESGAHVVFCVEDDPTQIGRLQAQGYTVLVPHHSYNEIVVGPASIIRSPLQQLTQEAARLLRASPAKAAAP